MIAIRNKRDLRKAYELLKFFSNERAVIEIKRDIRRYLSKERDRRIVSYSVSGDSVTYLVTTPDWIETNEDAKDWFKCNEELRRSYSAYDCTGESFTAWYKLVKRGDRWYCYHHICLDV